MEKHITPHRSLKILTGLSVLTLILMVIMSSLPPLSGSATNSAFGELSTWIFLLLTIGVFLFPYLSFQNGSAKGKKFLSVVMGISIFIVAACIIFAFIVLTEYSPKISLYGLILLGLLFIVLSIFWFAAADRTEEPEPVQAEPEKPFESHAHNRAPWEAPEKTGVEPKRVTIIDWGPASTTPANEPTTGAKQAQLIELEDSKPQLANPPVDTKPAILKELDQDTPTE